MNHDDVIRMTSAHIRRVGDHMYKCAAQLAGRTHPPSQVTGKEPVDNAINDVLKKSLAELVNGGASLESVSMDALQAIYAAGVKAGEDKATPPPGHIIDNGVVRKVLGTLPLTADGCVIGNKAWLWNIFPGAKGRDDDRPMRVCYKPVPITDPDAYTDGPMQMYSTREAAEAARKEGGT